MKIIPMDTLDTGRGTVEQTSPRISLCPSEPVSPNGKVVASEEAGKKSLATCPNSKELCPGVAPLQALGVEFERVKLEPSPWKG